MMKSIRNREKGRHTGTVVLFMVLQEEGCLEGEDKSRCTVFTPSPAFYSLPS